MLLLTLEWLRLCATRFHHAAEGGRLARRLHALFLQLGAGLFGLSILLFLFGGAQRIVLALVPLLSIAAGFADLRAALMRALTNAGDANAKNTKTARSARKRAASRSTPRPMPPSPTCRASGSSAKRMAVRPRRGTAPVRAASGDGRGGPS